MSKATSDAEIRRRINQLLPAVMTDAEWELLEEERKVGDIRDTMAPDAGAAAIEKDMRAAVQMAATFLLKVRRSQQSVTPRRGLRVFPPAQDLQEMAGADAFDREFALGMALHYLAAWDPEVMAFVREELDGVRLTDPSRAEGIDTAVWIEREWQRERAGLEGPEGNDRLQPQLTYTSMPRRDAEGVLRSQPVRTLPVVPGGKLDRLRLLAERLARRYRWEPAAAVNAILAAIMPIVPTLTTDVEWREDIPALTRITLRVDPAKTPAEVAEAYRRIRKQIVKAFPREMEQKSLFLALITLAFTPNAPHGDLMAHWNRAWFGPQGKPQSDTTAHRDWWYDDVQKFGRDQRRAVQRLLYPEYRRSPEDVEDENEKRTTDDHDHSDNDNHNA